jgi:EAL domain-containing protein (putative c-di-GMP-specific phosphodiesterase class I)
MTKDPLPRLRARLVELHQAIGGPPLRELETTAGLLGVNLGTSTAHDLLNGTGSSKWTTVEAFLRVCEKRAGHRLNPDLTDWKQAYDDELALSNGGRRRAGTETRVETCSNPLDQMVDCVTRLLDRLFPDDRPASSLTMPEWLEVVRAATESAAVGLIQIADGSRHVIAATSGFTEYDDEPALAEAVRRCDAERRAALGHVGYGRDGDAMVVIPLEYENRLTARVLVVVAPGAAYLQLGEVLASALKAALQVDLEDLQAAEVELLASWRREFGRLPLAIYERAFLRYQDVLRTLSVVFQPVISLATDPSSVTVVSWEALARQRAGAASAPAAILAAAHVWGDRFIIERDSVIAEKAIRTYKVAHEESVYKHSHSALSINVGVRSVLSDAYAETLKNVLREVGFGPRAVTLEISEQDPISPRRDEIWLPSPNEYFRQRLAKLAESLSVQFALDDFGVGHASLDRLSSLGLAHIKVDRAILHHNVALEEVELVIRIASRMVRDGITGAPRMVVVEGYDDAAPVSLEKLHEIGVHYIQGYITGKPTSAELRPLDDELRRSIGTRLRRHADAS